MTNTNIRVLDCGKRYQEDTSLTAGEVQVGNFPYHVGVYFGFNTKYEDDLKYLCGGSIISSKIIVTGII